MKQNNLRDYMIKNSINYICYKKLLYTDFDSVDLYNLINNEKIFTSFYNFTQNKTSLNGNPKYFFRIYINIKIKFKVV